MATVDSNSTYAQVVAAMDDNASWFEDNSATKAAAYVTAATIWLRRVPARQSSGDHDAQVQDIREQITAARDFINQKGRSGSTKAVRILNADSYR